jgi:uncharacterized membrane protein YphA (DoxX/SURF4 family)
MTNSFRFGRIVFGVAIWCLGAQNLIYSDFITGLEPVPAWIPARTFLAYLTGIFFVAASASIVINRKTRLAAIVLSYILFAIVLLLHLPNLAANLSSGSAWTTAFEMLALGGVALVLAAGSTGTLNSEKNKHSFFDKLAVGGRICYGVSLPVFGILHFIYSDYVAASVPAWIPMPLFWAYFTGVAHIAAGLSLITNVKSRLAGILLAVMFGSWVLILHLPRAVNAPSVRAEWTSLFVALAMCGGALLIVGSLADKESPSSNNLVA